MGLRFIITMKIVDEDTGKVTETKSESCEETLDALKLVVIRNALTRLPAAVKDLFTKKETEIRREEEAAALAAGKLLPPPATVPEAAPSPEPPDGDDDTITPEIVN